MNIYPPSKESIRDISNSFAFHCAGCTYKIPAERKWFLELYQLSNIVAELQFRVFGKYVCPKCHTITEMSYVPEGSMKPWMDYLDLYADTREGNVDQA